MQAKREWIHFSAPSIIIYQKRLPEAEHSSIPQYKGASTFPAACPVH